MVYSTILRRVPFMGKKEFALPFDSYRAVIHGGNPEILRSSFMNVLMFYPAGVLAGAAVAGRRGAGWKAALCILAFALFSAGIELIQYHYGLGWAESDDIIHNTLGAALGLVVIFIVLHFGYREKQNNKKTGKDS